MESETVLKLPGLGDPAVLNALLALDADEEVREIVADEIRRDEVCTERGKLAVVHSPKDLAQQISVRSHAAEPTTNKNAGTSESTHPRSRAFLRNVRCELS